MTEAVARGGRGTLLGASCVAAAAATGVQLVPMEAVKAHLAEAGGTPSASAVLAALRASLDLPSLGTMAALGAAGAWVAWLFLRAAGSPAGLGALVPASRPGRLALLLAAAWIFLRWHAAPGFMAGYDVDLHVSAVALAAREVALGRFPTWTDAWYLGFPLLRYYGAAYVLPAALLAAWTGDVRLGAKVTVAAWHLLAAPSAYALARASRAGRGPSLVAGIAYAACPYFVATLAHAGSLTAAPVIALAPLLLALALRTAREDGGWRDATALGATAAALLWAHPAYAVQASTLAAIVFVATAAGPRGGKGPALACGALAVAVAAAGALPLLHAWLVDGLPRAGAAPGALDLVRPGRANPDALRLLVTWTIKPSIPTGYVGLAALGLALVGAAAALPRRGAAAGFALLLLLVLSWCGPGFVRERALLFAPVVLVPMIAAAFEALAARRPRLAVAAGALLALDLLFGGIASPYRHDLEGFGRDLAAEASAQGAGRTVLVGEGPDGAPQVGEWQVGYEAPLRTIAGGFREAAPPAYGMLKGTLAWVEQDPDVRDPNLVRHLGALGVTSVRRVGRRSVAPGGVKVPAGSRVLFAREAALAPANDEPPPDVVAGWSAAMAAPAGSSPSAARRVLLPGEGPPLPGVEGTAPLPGADVAVDRRDGPVRTLVVRTPDAGRLRLDDAWVPGLRASVDGSAALATADVMGLVTIPIEAAGEHRITIEDPTSTRFWPGPAAALLALLVALLARRRPAGASAA